MTLSRPDRRQFGRRQTTAHGWICIDGRPRLPCHVANISDGGAMLQLDRPSWLPFRFHLIVETLGIDCYCEVRHQRENAIGVSFLKRAEQTSDRQRDRTGRTSPQDRSTWMGKP